MNKWRLTGRQLKLVGGSSLVLMCLLGGVGNSDAGQPTEAEQYFLELLNRARSNPGAEVTRLAALPWGGTPDLNEGVQSIPIVDQPYQPLAFNPDLVDAAGDYADLLIANHATGHFFGGSDPSSRMTAAGYSFTPAPGGGVETLSSSEEATFTIGGALVESHWSQVFINAGVFGRIDRLSLMREEYREIGVGISTGPGDGSGGVGTPFDAMTVANLAYNSGDPFLTGVFFDDQDDDGFYTPFAGEALGSVSVEVYNADTTLLVASFDTFSSGGYSVQLAPGDYELIIHDPVAGDQFVQGITLGSTNLKLDYLRSAIPEPSVATLLGLVAAIGFAGRRRRRPVSRHL